MIALVGWLLTAACFTALLACAPGTASAPASAAHVPPVPPPPVAAPIAQTSQLPWTPDPRFTGQWKSHSFTLAVDAGGTAAAAWRTYRWCSAAAPPCDDMIGSRITPGGSAALVLRHVEGSWAAADVQVTTDPSSVPLGAARLVLLPDGRLRLILESTYRPPVSLCRPAAARSTACGA